ncbi:DMT family transporter [Terrimonas sp. NA20]|uniref:DMT family transporter n=1 Tax=Terrimonas ginsenosidimutans TaxID=2908004 RepID=A0ABS9KL66_9BACT|nr:DMT family transporter [Terrimonas ginsenosidimutans]MCG2613054.1 DMT family transporter [Terrimonas ginsenosidimutans]
MPSPKSKTGALLSIILIVTIWGSASAVTKVAVESIPPYFFAFLRNGVAAICLIPYYLIHKKKMQLLQAGPPMKKVALMGLTGITFFYLFFNMALYYTTAAAGALIQGFIPISIILLSIIFLKERLRKVQIAGVVCSMAGVVLIGFVGEFYGARNAILGNTLMIFAVLAWGFYTIISKSLERYDAVQLTAISTTIGTLVLIPAVAIELWRTAEFPSVSFKAWLAVLYLGIFSSAICYILYNRVLKTLSGVQVGNFMNFDPVIGAAIAIIFLSEKVTVWQILGALLVLMGVALTSRRGRTKQ